MSLFRTVFTRCSYVVFCTLLTIPAFAATKGTPTWIEPTQAELQMTSQPEVPGAASVVLYHEEIVNDPENSWSFYKRIKILNEKGRNDNTSIPINYPRANVWTNSWESSDYDIRSFAGRTIHSDGTIIPFTGAPQELEVRDNHGEKEMKKVFALPDIQVGSIIEYRYTLVTNFKLNVTYSFIPSWYIQGSAFERKEHFEWFCRIPRVAWTTILPPNAGPVKDDEVAGMDYNEHISFDIANVMPAPNEPQMAPFGGLTSRILFYQTHHDVHTPDEFWKERGKDWSRDINSFAKTSSAITETAAQITASAATPEEKLRRIYAAVQALKNTDFTRKHTEQEDKASGIQEPKSVADVLAHKQGGNVQLNELFVALARAAGFKAYIMAVTNRDRSIFLPQWLTFDQLHDDISIVELDGKERYFDPAEPFCPFGQLFWTHADTSGIRQTATGSALASVPAGTIEDSVTERLAGVIIDPSGKETGGITLVFRGMPAIRYRQRVLRNDEKALRDELEDLLHSWLPGGTEVSSTTFENLSDTEKPLLAHFKITGPLATSTAKHALLPGQLFEVSETATFTASDRKTWIFYNYPQRISDQVVVKVPHTWSVESQPEKKAERSGDNAGYQSFVEVSGNQLTMRRDSVTAAIDVKPEDYPGLRDYFTRVITADHEPVVFSIKPAASAQ